MKAEFFGGFVIGLLLGLAGLLIAMDWGTESVRSDAVERGFAERVINPEGKIVFKWRGRNDAEDAE